MLLLPHLDYLSYTRACARAHAHTHTHTRADAKKYLLKKATVWPRRDLLNKIRRIHTGFFPPVRPQTLDSQIYKSANGIHPPTREHFRQIIVYLWRLRTLRALKEYSVLESELFGLAPLQSSRASFKSLLWGNNRFNANSEDKQEVLFFWKNNHVFCLLNEHGFDLHTQFLLALRRTQSKKLCEFEMMEHFPPLKIIFSEYYSNSK